MCRLYLVPSNLTDIRSFLELVNQLGEFTLDLESAMQALHPLLSSRTWICTSEYTVAFEIARKELSRQLVLAYFDPFLPTVQQTDASKLHGLAFVMLQDHGEGKWRLVACGCRFLSDPETCYAVVHLEILAAQWSIYKCHFYH